MRLQNEANVWQVKFAGKEDLPFLTYNGVHGAITTIGKMDHGIEIFLKQLDSVELSEDGSTAKIGGGIGAKALIDKLWEEGKQTGTSEIMKHEPLANTRRSHRYLRMRQLRRPRPWRRTWMASRPSRSDVGPIRLDGCGARQR